MASFVSQENVGPPQLLSLHPLITLGAISRLNSIRSQGVISKYECQEITQKLNCKICQLYNQKPGGRCMRKDTRVWTRIEGIQYYLWSFFWGCATLSCKLSIISRFSFPLKQLKAICLGSRLWVRFKFWSHSGTQIEKLALPEACSFYGRGQNIRGLS